MTTMRRLDDDRRTTTTRRLAWTIPILFLAPLGLGAKGCDNGVVGDECAGEKAVLCAGSGGGGSAAGGMTAAGGKTAGGKTGAGGKAATGGSTAAGGSTSDPKACGNFADAACPPNAFCSFPVGTNCGAADGPGVCTVIPDVCRDIYDPVCGCDGKTYSNDCEAAGNAVSVRTKGECGAPEPTACGGLLGLQCKAGEYCAYPIEALCGAADQTGTCAPIPEACDTIYDPVCGCDGATHSSACVAAMKSVAVAAKGECAGTGGTTCGGLRGLQCNDGEYCNYAPDALCGRADATGTCAKKTMGCTKELNEVCGCDGNSYGNPCMAAAAGVSVEYAGRCK